MRALTITLVAALSIFLLSSTAVAADSLKDFTFTGLNGENIGLNDVKGKPVVISVMSVSCYICRKDSGELQKTYLSFKNRGVVFLGVFIRSSDNAIGDFVKDTRLSLPVGKSPEIVDQLGVFAVPVTAFVSRDGRIVRRIIGPYTYSSLAANIDTILQ